MLSAGTRLGPYEILAKLGSGGMGEVYRARDTKLGRDVALKVLPESFMHDPERAARFRREAQVLAALNHPDIGTIYGLDEANGQQFLVLELIDGETLADRLKRGALPLDEAIASAKQIAEALEAAHEKGIIHRDLKPANIALTKDGNVKVLDFGLAKATERTTESGLDPMNSPTITSPAIMTGAHVILGTAAYMSPEQAKGRIVDKRSDIWAFGCVLYEMLTGKRLFQGEDVTETLAAVVMKEPDLTAAPAKVRRLLARCLAKEPKKRLRDIGDVWDLLDDRAPVASPRSPLWGGMAWVASVLLVICITLTTIIVWHREPELGMIRFSFMPPLGGTFGHTISGRGTGTPAPHFAPSPDGRRLAYVMFTNTGKPQLWLRGMDSGSGQPVPGTEDASFPFWSPDGRFVAFFAQGKLKRVDASGGAPQTVCDAPAGEGGTWNRAGEILFAPDGTGGLYRVAASGGVASPVTTLDRALTERSHRWPQFLPDGQHFLYLAMSEQQVGALYVGSLDSMSGRRLVVKPGLRTQYASSGHLLFLREGTLMAQPFDTRAFRLTGEPITLAEDVAYNSGYGNNAGIGRTAFAVSDSGVLMYRTTGGLAVASLGIASDVAWFDRTGKRAETVVAPAVHAGMRLSPDETKLMVRRLDRPGGLGDLWMVDLARGAIPSRFTFAPDHMNMMPIWSPDERRIAFASGWPGPFDLYEKPAGGTGDTQLLLKSSLNKFPTDWSSDGRFLAYFQTDPKTKNDLWILPMSSAGQPTPFLQTPFNELNARFSPDGKWIAYVSDQGGALDVYVRNFPAGDREWRISVGGGEDPQWRRDGKELFYVARARELMAVDVEAASSFAAGVPRVLFDTRTTVRSLAQDQRYAVAANGQRFLINAQSDAGTPITVVINWQEELKARVPTK